MRISDLTTHVLHDGYRNLVFVRLLTDDGLTGLGEATLINRTEAVVAYLHGHVKPALLGQDPAMGGRLWRDVYSGGFVRGGITTMAGLSAVAMALLDIEGKRMNVPAWRLLGGAVHERVPVYANAWYTVEREPSAIAERARLVLAMGYRALKIDPFGPGSYELSHEEERRSLAILGAVRDAVGPDVELFVEGHGRFSTGQATRMVRALAEVRAGWFEEPTSWDDPAAWLEVRRASAGAVPVAGGEHFSTRYGFRDALAGRWVDIIQPDVGYAGGPMELVHIASMADAFGIVVALHDSSGPVNTAASLHAAVTIPNLKIVELFNDFSAPFVRDAVIGHPVARDGWLDLPTAPGLGVDLDLDVIAEHPYENFAWNLFEEGWERRFARE
jgi:galactonate dehydratase